MTRLCHSTAEAISKLKGEQLSQRFRDTFLPGGRALLPGSFLRMSSLAGVLEAGLSNFYEGNFSQEIEDEVNDIHTSNEFRFHGQNVTSFFLCFHSKVRANGGVLSRDDISNYSVQVEQPEEVLYNGKD